MARKGKKKKRKKERTCFERKAVNGRRVCYKPKVNLSALKKREMLVRKEVGEEEFVQERVREFHSGIATAKKEVRKRAELLGGNSRLCGDLRFRVQRSATDFGRRVVKWGGPIDLTSFDRSNNRWHLLLQARVGRSAWQVVHGEGCGAQS